jgi:hypothetical protein
MKMKMEINPIIRDSNRSNARMIAKTPDTSKSPHSGQNVRNWDRARTMNLLFCFWLTQFSIVWHASITGK